MRVLIVEDEPNLGRQLRSTLEGAGYAVDLATDGEDGHYLGSTENYDAVILDDIGYVQQSREEMEVLFTFLAERYERRSVIITSNTRISATPRSLMVPGSGFQAPGSDCEASHRERSRCQALCAPRLSTNLHARRGGQRDRAMTPSPSAPAA